jgi:HPt (histidine-containing phosphotransfer) domain-containing protein
MTADMQARLSVMRERYKGRVERESRELAQLVLSLASGGGDQAVAAIARLAHGLAGSAGTFGFDDVGACAAALEREVAAIDANGKITPALADAVQALSAAAARMGGPV